MMRMGQAERRRDATTGEWRTEIGERTKQRRTWKRRDGMKSARRDNKAEHKQHSVKCHYLRTPLESQRVPQVARLSHSCISSRCEVDYNASAKQNPAALTRLPFNMNRYEKVLGNAAGPKLSDLSASRICSISRSMWRIDALLRVQSRNPSPASSANSEGGRHFVTSPAHRTWSPQSGETSDYRPAPGRGQCDHRELYLCFTRAILG